MPEKTVDDEDFEREYERMLAEAFRTPSNAGGPALDMTVPTNVRQKFTRNVGFGEFFWFEFKKRAYASGIALDVDVRLD